MIRAVGHDCDRRHAMMHAPAFVQALAGCHIELEFLAGRPGVDAWIAFARAERLEAGELPPVEAMLETLAPMQDWTDHLLAVFGMPWDDISRAVIDAMLRAQGHAPAWFGAELAAWRPDELAVLRGNVCGGQESIVRALRAVHEYRLSVDRLPPLAGRGTADG